MKFSGLIKNKTTNLLRHARFYPLNRELLVKSKKHRFSKKKEKNSNISLQSLILEFCQINSWKPKRNSVYKEQN